MVEDKLQVPRLDFTRTTQEICALIRNTVTQARANGAVLGLSGGVDSSLTAALCVQALGHDRVLGILMPTSFTPTQDMSDAQTLAEQFQIPTKYISIHNMCNALIEELPDQPESNVTTAIANIRARIRMVLLYYYANAQNYLVAGTGDRSELLIGFFTKYGDGGVDLLPIGHLYKTQVRELAKYLQISEQIAYKPSSPQLYPGHKLSDELPLDYPDIDRILIGLVDRALTPAKVSRLTKIPLHFVEEIFHRYSATRHKRLMPPMVTDF